MPRRAHRVFHPSRCRLLLSQCRASLDRAGRGHGFFLKAGHPHAALRADIDGPVVAMLEDGRSGSGHYLIRTIRPPNPAGHRICNANL
jgi:hypothetical protein